MKLAHLSDTHLGYPGRGMPRMLEDPHRPGVLLHPQEMDIRMGLEEAICEIIERVRPDLVIHSGDLFHTSRPTPYILDFAMAQCKRLSDAGIPLVIIEGTHSSPRVQGQGHTLQLLSYLPGVAVVFADAAKLLIDELAIHALPHRALALGRGPERSATDSRRVNVLVGYGVADGNGLYRTGRPAPYLPVAACASWYDYVALGHCHRFEQIPGTTRAFYAGSTAMVTEGDFHPGHLFGFNVVTIEAGDPVVDRQTVTTRPMHAYGLNSAGGLSADEVLTFLQRQADEVSPDGACCEVIVGQLDPHVRREISTQAVREVFAGAVVLTVRLVPRDERLVGGHRAEGEGEEPTARFARLVAESAGDEGFKAEVLELGRSLLDNAAAGLVADDLADRGTAIREGGA